MGNNIAKSAHRKLAQRSDWPCALCGESVPTFRPRRLDPPFLSDNERCGKTESRSLGLASGSLAHSVHVCVHRCSSAVPVLSLRLRGNTWELYEILIANMDY